MKIAIRKYGKCISINLHASVPFDIIESPQSREVAESRYRIDYQIYEKLCFSILIGTIKIFLI